jgi:integrase
MGRPTGRRGRRANGEGSIYRREQDGRWVAALTVAEGGKRKYLTGKTRQEVQQKLARAVRDRDDGLSCGDGRQGVGDYFARWLASAGPNLRPGSRRAYERDVRLRIARHLGPVTLAKLSPQHLQSLYGTLLASGLSSTTVHACHVVLHKGLSDAVKLGLVARNVSELVAAPRVRQTEMHVWSEAETRRFLDATKASGDRQYALYALALATGMRLGELLALTWRAVDLRHLRLSVLRSVDVDHGVAEWGEPKTRRGKRQISFSADVAAVLGEHRARQNVERLAVGPAWDDAGLVFPDEVGGALSHARVYPRHFLRCVERAGVPPIRFHDLRHTFATVMLGRGVNVKVVSEMLGHADVAITLRTYFHVQPGMQRAASEEMGSVLFG